MRRLRIAMCQMNAVVGDLDGNVQKMLQLLARAENAGVDLAAFPELAITGYPPEDLLLKPGFVADNIDALQTFAGRTDHCVAIVGFVDSTQDLHNAAAVCAAGAVQGVYHKRLLPNYAVFDEQRYFRPGDTPTELFLIGGVKVGIAICEDAWSAAGPISEEAAGGADLIVNINASPFHGGRLPERERMLATRATDAACPLVYVNQVGGQDELIFDGASMTLDADGSVVAAAAQFQEELSVFDFEIRPAYRRRLLSPRGRQRRAALPVTPISSTARDQKEPLSPTVARRLDRVEEIYAALVLGTRDYVTKNGFSDVVVGLSGGVDSSLVATIAADALSAEQVHGVSMPSRYSSKGSRSDASDLAQRLGIDYRTIPIEDAHSALMEMLAPSFGDRAPDLAEENLQSRIRGVVLMALSNKFGWMVLTTGNKSETAVGYSTLYGDTAGGFAVLKDVPKTMVYELCNWRNRDNEVIPRAVLEKPPSAELRPDQRDDQSLPAYEVLDPVLQAYIEDDLTAAELVEAGFEDGLVKRVVSLVDRAEYKRRQSPPGPRVTSKAFGKDRRVPITNKYKG